MMRCFRTLQYLEIIRNSYRTRTEVFSASTSSVFRATDHSAERSGRAAAAAPMTPASFFTDA